MATNYTENLALCLWAADDPVLRTEFNADHRKIDAAITDLKISIGVLEDYDGSAAVTVSLGRQPRMVIVGNKVGFSNIITGNSTSSSSGHTVAMPGYPGYHSYLTGDLLTSGVALEVTQDGFTLNPGFNPGLAPYFYLAIF